MRIDRNLIERIDIAQFADRHGLIMEVCERNPNICKDMNIAEPYYTYFKGAEVKKGACLSSEYGNGMNEEEAIVNYAERISNTTLVFNAFGRDRHEIKVPYLSYSPVVNTKRR